MNKLRIYLNLVTFCLVICVLAVMFVVTPEQKISLSERRLLMTFEEVKNPEEEGTHPFDVIDSYMLDQFPLRDSFRSMKAFLQLELLGKNDNNGIYQHEGTVVKIEDTLDENQINYTAELMQNVVKKYFADDRIFYSIIPDKHYFASKENGYPALDYQKLFDMMKQNLGGFEYVDIASLLTLSDYYKTDSHWSQEKIYDVAVKLVEAMNNDARMPDEKDFKVNTLTPFYGVYYGQSALSLAPDEIKYLSNKTTDEMIMTVIDDKGKPNIYPVYVTEMFNNNDPYDLFAAGAQHIVIIEKPNADNDKELVVFRDSFGSSIAPLLSLGYKKVTFIDLRYIIPDWIKNIANFGDDVDVLFLYSTGLVNGGRILNDFTPMTKNTLK